MAQSAVTLYTVGTIKEIPGVRTYVSVDGGMSDNPRPVLYGSGYEAFLPRITDGPAGSRPRSGKHCESGACSFATRRSPTVAVGTSAPGHRRARALHGLQLQQGAPPRRGVRARGQAREVAQETYADLLRHDLL